jgi:hypothetical protein
LALDFGFGLGFGLWLWTLALDFGFGHRAILVGVSPVRPPFKSLGFYLMRDFDFIFIFLYPKG